MRADGNRPCKADGAALIEERLLDDEAERGIRSSPSPVRLARLLLVR